MITNLLSNIRTAGACVCVLAAAVASGVEVQAAETVNLGELQNGVPTEYPGNFCSVEAYFNVPFDGPMRVTFTGDVLYAFSDPEYSQEITDFEFSYIDGKPTRVYQCNAGEVIYFYNNFVMTGGTITVVSGDMALEMIGTSPSVDPESSDYYGGSYSISSEYRVQFMFNQPIEVEGARMTVNGSPTMLTPSVATTTVEIEVSPVLMQMYKSGALKKGDTMRLELYGVHEKGNAENKVNGDGLASVEFVMDAQPIELVSTKNTPQSGVDNMLSYYVPGDPRSLVQLIFSGPVESGEHTPKATLQYGDLDNLEAGMYYETLEGSVDGDTVTFDLAGKLRRPSDMLPLLTNPLEYIGFVVSGVRGQDGQMAYTGYMANPFNFVYNYKIEVLQYNVVADFTPSAGKGLEEGQEMEIFVMEGDKLTYDGVKFSYTAAGNPADVIIGKEDLDISFENGTDLVIVLNAPALPGIDADSEVTVTLANMQCADGLDHDANVTVVYKDFTTGVDAVVNGEESMIDIYTAQGVLVRKSVNTSEIRNLPAGLYIAGGRKVMVK